MIKDSNPCSPEATPLTRKRRVEQRANPREAPVRRIRLLPRHPFPEFARCSTRRFLASGVASGGKSVPSSIPNEKRSLERATAEAVRSEGDTTGMALASAILPASKIEIPHQLFTPATSPWPQGILLSFQVIHTCNISLLTNHSPVGSFFCGINLATP